MLSKLRTFLAGHLGIPFFLHIFFKAVAQIPNVFATSVMGRWKYWERTSKSTGS